MITLGNSWFLMPVDITNSLGPFFSYPTNHQHGLVPYSQLLHKPLHLSVPGVEVYSPWLLRAMGFWLKRASHGGSQSETKSQKVSRIKSWSG